MCGITGWFDPTGLSDPDAAGILRGMTDALRHRGPDDAGTWLDPEAGVALGFRRLAILDLSEAGRQPMHAATGRHVIVFNGEVYNFRRLREELEALGHRFRGHSDTEVLLAAVTQWGVRGAVERCNGMFAFALWDRDRRTLQLCRDRAGEKPLYYGWAGGRLLFASELKALRRHPQFRGEVDRDILALYLRRGYVPAPYTIYRGVYKLPPATILTLSAAHRDAPPEPYWSWREVAERGTADPFLGTDAEALDELDGLLRDAVRIRLESDVPLGAFLSGGIDSSLVVALMQAQGGPPVRTFAIGFHGGRLNEAPHAAAVARHLGTKHTELYVSPDEALGIVPLLPALYDEPFADSSQIPTFIVCRLARQDVTVSLSGDAGDELFAGYGGYAKMANLWRAMDRLPHGVRLAGAALLRGTAHLPRPLVPALDRLGRKLTGKRSLSERLRQAAEILPLRTPEELFHYYRSYWKRPASVVPGAVEPPDAVGAATPANPLATIEAELMYRDAVSFLADDILVKVDRASMGVSLESRIPMLDPRVIAFACRLPLSFKMRGGTGKWILRELAYRYVPRAILDRPKAGFHAPIAHWLRGALRPWAESLLDARRLRDEGYFDPAIVQQKLREHVSGRTSWDYDLWTVLMFQSWLDEQTRAVPAPPATTGHSHAMGTA